MIDKNVLNDKIEFMRSAVALVTNDQHSIEGKILLLQSLLLQVQSFERLLTEILSKLRRENGE